MEMEGNDESWWREKVEGLEEERLQHACPGKQEKGTGEKKSPEGTVRRTSRHDRKKKRRAGGKTWDKSSSPNPSGEGDSTRPFSNSEKREKKG